MSPHTTTTQHRDLAGVLADCAQARKDLDTAHSRHHATIRAAIEAGTTAQDLAQQLKVSQTDIHQIAARAERLDPGRYPPVDNELIVLPVGQHTEQFLIPPLLGSLIGIDTAGRRLRHLAAKAHNAATTEIADTVGYQVDELSQQLDEHDQTGCEHCDEPENEPNNNQRRGPPGPREPKPAPPQPAGAPP